MSELMEFHKSTIEANAFAVYNRIVVRDMQPDYAEVTLDLDENSLNPMGSAHGGALFSVADVCAGMTARTDARHYVTQQASVSFLRGCGSGRITARSKVVNRSRSFCMVQVDITDEAGKLLFEGTFHFFCVDR